MVESLALNPPRYPRDLIWFPARLEMRHRGLGEVFLPVLYPNSYKDGDAQVKLGRVSDFSETEPVLGKGSRLFLAGDEPLPLLEWRELVIEEPEATIQFSIPTAAAQDQDGKLKVLCRALPQHEYDVDESLTIFFLTTLPTVLYSICPFVMGSLWGFTAT